ncbi:transcriptional regulator, LysR family [Fulvimarina manganoxydans]|uniref:Transcriptional regulator, LysR family n=1 Tax=Fulvimarina manganoxydans TaxID=937218 RepID=A0A1W2E104_9HYPH|nr:LysR family transcriptional regulator [Fulvimarina manganoxydans]SMD02728.1 transcriptional regulator, LysR family [Fulvimarina manganoxydans]
MADGLEGLSWDDIRLIGLIAETRSLPAAAAELGAHHSTVFRRLRQIEAAVGAPLFERDGTQLVASGPGEEIAALSRQMRDAVDAATLKLKGREALPAGELRVATNDSLLIGLLTPIFARFRAACPDVHLDVIVSNQALNLSRRDADVAIRATDSPPETLVGRRLARIAWAQFGPAGGTSAIDAGGDETPWIALGETMGAMKVVRHALAEKGSDQLRYRVDTVLGLAAAVEAGIGIGHLPCFVGDRSPSLMRLGPVEPSFSTDLWLLTHADLRHAARVRAFTDFVAAEIAELRPLIEGARSDETVTA